MSVTETAIRVAERADATKLEAFLAENDPAWAELARSYIQCAFSSDYRKPTFLAAFKDDQIIGTAAITEELFTIGTWGISWVLVAPAERGKGCGRRLLQECLDQIAKHASGPVTVILNTYPGKTRLYERLGFTAGGFDHEGGSYMLKILNI